MAAPDGDLFWDFFDDDGAGPLVPGAEDEDPSRAFFPVSAHQRKPKIANRGLNGIEWTKGARSYREHPRRIFACHFVCGGDSG